MIIRVNVVVGHGNCHARVTSYAAINTASAITMQATTSATFSDHETSFAI